MKIVVLCGGLSAERNVSITSGTLICRVLADTVTAYRQIMTGADAASVSAEYMKRWGDMPFSTGYYGQKTIR